MSSRKSKSNTSSDFSNSKLQWQLPKEKSRKSKKLSSDESTSASEGKLKTCSTVDSSSASVSHHHRRHHRIATGSTGASGATGATCESLTSSGQIISPTTPLSFLNITNFSPIEWGIHVGGVANEVGTGVVTDAEGNVYVTGTSNSPIIQIFNVGNTGVTGNVLLPNPSDGEQFIVKYNSSGSQLWATRITIGSIATTPSVAVDSNGNVYAAGTSNVTPIFIYNAGNMGNTGDASLPGNTNGDGYLVKFNSNGIVQWVTYIAGAQLGDINLTDIAVDPTGNVYVCGQSFNATTTYFNAGNTGNTGNLQVPGATVDGSTFLAKYNGSGVVQWATHTNGNNVDFDRGLAVDLDGNVYITGAYFDTTLNIFSAGNTGSTPNYTLPKFGSPFDAYVIAFNTNGGFLWATHISGNLITQGIDIAVDANSNVYATGYANNTIHDFYNAGNTGSTANLTVPNGGGATATFDQYIVKYTSSGIVQWATRVSAFSEFDFNNSTSNAGITTDISGNVYITGNGYANPISFYSSGDVGTVAELSMVDPNAPLFVAYVAKYSTNGGLLTADELGGTGSERAGDIAVDSFGNVYTTGSYTANPLQVFGVISLGGTGTTGVLQITNSSFTGSTDAYLIKYGSPDVILPAGLFCGQRKIIITTNASSCISVIPAAGVTIGNNVTSLMTCQVGNTIELLWTGTQWIVVSDNGFSLL